MRRAPLGLGLLIPFALAAGFGQAEAQQADPNETRFNSTHPFEVFVVHPDRRVEVVGETPTEDGGDLHIQVPEGGTWGLKLERLGPAIVQELQRARLPALVCYEMTITDEAAKHLASLTSLTSLNLSWSQITDGGLKHLASVTNLSYLDISEGCPGITDEGLKHLTSHTRLKLDAIKR